MSNKKKVYGVYDLKDAEKLVCMGDKREVSEYTGLDYRHSGFDC